MSEFFVNTIVGTIVGALATVVFGWAVKAVQSWRGDFTGKWTQIIPAFDGEPEKIAIVDCKHRGDRLYATTLRTQPDLGFPQRWKVEARISSRGLIYGIYWPENMSQNPGSYGSLQFKVVTDNLFAGFYVRARVVEDPNVSNEFQEKLKTIPIRWERIIPRTKPDGK